jgi:hypothetical protein
LQGVEVSIWYRVDFAKLPSRTQRISYPVVLSDKVPEIPLPISVVSISYDDYRFTDEHVTSLMRCHDEHRGPPDHSGIASEAITLRIVDVSGRAIRVKT